MVALMATIMVESCSAMWERFSSEDVYPCSSKSLLSDGMNLVVMKVSNRFPLNDGAHIGG